MKRTSRLHKQLSLSKETVRDLMAADLSRAVGGLVVSSDAASGKPPNSCNTACGQWSCAVC